MQKKELKWLRGDTFKSMIKRSIESDPITIRDRRTCESKGWPYPGPPRKRRR